MKCLSRLIIIFWFYQLGNAQHLEFDWAINNGGLNYEEGYALTVDDAGNVYSTGYFSGVADFDPGLDTMNLTAVGNHDVFLQKLNPYGELIWVKQLGGSGTSRAYSVKTDSEENVYVLGFFTGIIDFDPGIGTSYSQSLGEADVFLVKLDSNGSLLWYKKFGGTEPDHGRSLDLDLFGNIYVTGGFDGTVDFDPGSGVFNLTSVGGADIFIQKLTIDGEFIWAKSIGGSITTYGPFEKGIVSDSLGNVYFSGYFIGTIDADPGPVENNLTWTSGGFDVFLEKLDSNGNFVWVKQMGGFSQNKSSSIVIDKYSNLYLSGYYNGTVDFDPSTELYNLSSEKTNSYIQKFDSAGNFIWVKEIKTNSSILGAQFTIINSLAVDNNDYLYSSGYFEGIVDFDPNEQVFNLNSGNSQGDVFIQKLNNDGQFVWATKFGSENHEYSNSIFVDNEKNIYAMGDFRENQDSIDFDPTTGVSNLESYGLTDIFVQKLSQCIPSLIYPDVDSLNQIIALCQINDSIIEFPLAFDNCGNEIIGTSSHSFPITNQSISQITWFFEDGYGNSTSQNQNISWLSIDDSIYINGNELIANNSNASYQWIECTSEYYLLPGDTNQFFTPLFNGHYALEVTENGCVDTSVCMAINNVTVDLYSNMKDIKIYPNPSNGNFQIHFNENRKLQDIVVYSSIGENVYQMKELTEKEPKSFNLNLPDGMYFIKLKVDDSFYFKQLVIRK